MDELYSLLLSGRVEDAIQKIKTIKPSQEQVWELTALQLQQRRFDRASRLMETIDPSSIIQRNVSHFVMLALKESQFSLALKWSVALKGERPNPYDCVAVALDKDLVDIALKSISDLNLQGYDIRALIERLMKQENFTSARKYAQRFGLEDAFPPERIIEGMMAAGQWENALNLRNQTPKLKEELTGLKFFERIIHSRDWVSALRYAEQFGIPPKSSSSNDLTKDRRLVLRSMIDGMVRDGKLFQAMRLTFAHHFQTEFPPKQLISTMIKERQYAHALRFIKALNMESEFANEIPRINRERMRELSDFRRLMEVRKRDFRSRHPAVAEAKVVVANIFLGTRTLLIRPDGKVVIVPPQGLGMMPTMDEIANEYGHGEDEEEEEIMFNKKAPSAQNATLNVRMQNMSVDSNQAMRSNMNQPPPTGMPLHIQQGGGARGGMPMGGFGGMQPHSYPMGMPLPGSMMPMPPPPPRPAYVAMHQSLNQMPAYPGGAPQGGILAPPPPPRMPPMHQHAMYGAPLNGPPLQPMPMMHQPMFVPRVPAPSSQKQPLSSVEIKAKSTDGDQEKPGTKKKLMPSKLF